MNIIIGDIDADKMRDKYTVLPLQDIKFHTHPDLPPVTSYCLVENIPVDELPKLQEQVDLHIKFYKNFQKPDFNYCEQALEHLKGKWGGQVDSYYEIMEQSINECKLNEDLQWDPILYK
jgi:hypothetical protein